MNDPTAMVDAALLGLGLIWTAVPDALKHLEDRTLIRRATSWYVDAGSISLYCANRKLWPAKTRAFIDFVAKNPRSERMAERFSGSFASLSACSRSSPSGAAFIKSLYLSPWRPLEP
ncbi:hypothetical protein [Rhizobium tubonense]|uniref:hypothetical protein n=1 Tax=Rhizobium tubonense TaxID=484088 RepID=UPI0011B7C1B4|nr:hypothetical protein [Rhizobium tubonense]